jgi:hypothetical protein
MEANLYDSETTIWHILLDSKTLFIPRVMKLTFREKDYLAHGHMKLRFVSRTSHVFQHPTLNNWPWNNNFCIFCFSILYMIFFDRINIDLPTKKNQHAQYFIVSVGLKEGQLLADCLRTYLGVFQGWVHIGDKCIEFCYISLILFGICYF